MNEDIQRVETSTILFGEVCDAVDPSRQRENELKHVAYTFGGGRVEKRDGDGVYAA